MVVAFFFFVGMLLYIALTIILVRVAVVTARKAGKVGWKRGLGVLVVLLAIPFWDWLPTIVAMRHYCDTEAGFTVHKSVGQWLRENPDLQSHSSLSELPERFLVNVESTRLGGERREYLLPNGFRLSARFRSNGERITVELFRPGEKRSYWLNRRIALEISTRERAFGLNERRETIFDFRDEEVLASYVDFNSGQSQRHPDEIRDWKLWLYSSSCYEDRRQKPIQKFNKLVHTVKSLGKVLDDNK